MKTRIKIKYDDSNSPKTVEWWKSYYDKGYYLEEIDPYHRVFNLSEGVYGLFEESADGAGDPWIYLIDGPERAMVIDTGFGIGNLRGLIEELIGKKELIVAVTHEHLDHCMGSSQFESVYCHMFCVPAITKNFMKPSIWDHLYDEKGKGIWLDFDKKDIIKYNSFELIPFLEGKQFDLGGGHVIEAVHTPGHAPGGASFIDHRNRFLFIGAVHTNYIRIGGRPGPFGEYGKVRPFLESLYRLKEKHWNEFDRIFPAHEIIDLPKTFLDDQIKACEDILANPDCYEFTAQNRRGGIVKYHGVGDAGVGYTDAAVC